MTTNPDTANPDTANPSEPSGTARWTEQRIRALGAVTDLPTAASIFGLGRSLAYELAKHDQFPVPVIRVGTRFRVPVAAILAALHLPTAGLDPTGEPSVDHHHEIRTPDEIRSPHRTDTRSPE